MSFSCAHERLINPLYHRIGQLFHLHSNLNGVDHFYFPQYYLVFRQSKRTRSYLPRCRVNLNYIPLMSATVRKVGRSDRANVCIYRYREMRHPPPPHGTDGEWNDWSGRVRRLLTSLAITCQCLNMAIQNELSPYSRYHLSLCRRGRRRRQDKHARPHPMDILLFPERNN